MNWVEVYSSLPDSLPDSDDDIFRNMHLETDFDENIFAPFQPAPIATIQAIQRVLFDIYGRNQRKLLDLGSGAGSFCVAMSQEANWLCTGVELSQRLVNQANSCAEVCGVDQLTSFYCDNMLTCAQSLDVYDVVIVYLLPESLLLQRLRDLIQFHYDNGSTLVTIRFHLDSSFNSLHKEDTASFYKKASI
jgi:protein-L-isoaspartate O-methyltransferase